MDRKEFLKNMGIFGLGLPFFSTLLKSCSKEDLFYDEFGVNFNGKITIIGAGAAGLTAGYILQRHNIDFEIIEAAADFGGRVKKTDDFADFPIDLGGEWIHTDPSILTTLINDQTVDASIDIINYNPKTISLWKNNKLKKRNIVSHFYSEHKFKSSTWYDFFDQFIVPSIRDKIILNSPVTSIDYSGDRVEIKTTNDATYTADKVLVTVPIKILQTDMITFQPELPSRKVEAINSIDIPPILKVFIEFSERFYPDIIQLGRLWSDDLYYDAAFGKDSSRNILGLFAIGERGERYGPMTSEDDIIKGVLEELDEIFDGKASATYQKHVIQNWTQEPFIQGSYSHFQESANRTIETLVEPVDNRIYFAGEACVDGDTSTVHGAGESAYQVVEEMLKA